MIRASLLLAGGCRGLSSRMNRLANGAAVSAAGKGSRSSLHQSPRPSDAAYAPPPPPAVSILASLAVAALRHVQRLPTPTAPGAAHPATALRSWSPPGSPPIPPSSCRSAPPRRRSSPCTPRTARTPTALCSRVVQHVAQHPQQRRIRLHVHRHCLFVHIQCQRHSRSSRSATNSLSKGLRPGLRSTTSSMN